MEKTGAKKLSLAILGLLSLTILKQVKPVEGREEQGPCSDCVLGRHAEGEKKGALGVFSAGKTYRLVFQSLCQ